VPQYRCLNNLFGYCQHPSRHGQLAADCSDIGHPGVNVLHVTPSTGCPFDPLNCGFFIAWQQEYQRIGVPTPTE